MGMGTVLIACPSCACHAFAREVRCPSCGAPLRAADGSIQRTAGAVMLGLTLTVTSVAAGSCGGAQATSSYGVGPTTGEDWQQASSSTGNGASTASGTGGEGGMGGHRGVGGAGGEGGQGGAGGQGGEGGQGGAGQGGHGGN